MGVFSSFRTEKKSKNIAKDRLKLVLIHDKNGGYSPQIVEKLQGEILSVIRNYLEVDEEQVEIKIIKTKKNTEDDMVSSLVANIPIKRIK
ncbi:cell division topological specificity factor MinE [Filifactor alocis]|uniref:cell division topological specificity factor MinE n=1 Tax=Filifactor alocis TaxID=143361 RepID=UPI003FA094AB